MSEEPNEYELLFAQSHGVDLDYVGAFGCIEILATLHANAQFNRELYIRNLKRLPGEPEE